MLKGAQAPCQSDIFSLPVRNAQHLSELLVGVLFVNNLEKMLVCITVLAVSLGTDHLTFSSDFNLYKRGIFLKSETACFLTSWIKRC